MTKEEMIEHWANIAAAVFKAEDAISAQWKMTLVLAKGKSDTEKQQIADDYLRAIATEILDNTNWQMEDE